MDPLLAVLEHRNASETTVQRWFGCRAGALQGWGGVFATIAAGAASAMGRGQIVIVWRS